MHKRKGEAFKTTPRAAEKSSPCPLGHPRAPALLSPSYTLAPDNVCAREDPRERETIRSAIPAYGESRGRERERERKVRDRSSPAAAAGERGFLRKLARGAPIRSRGGLRRRRSALFSLYLSPVFSLPFCLFPCLCVWPPRSARFSRDHLY